MTNKLTYKEIKTLNTFLIVSLSFIQSFIHSYSNMSGTILRAGVKMVN